MQQHTASFPPRPSRTFRVGVTGHRHLPHAETPCLIRRIESVLTTVQQAVTQRPTTDGIHPGTAILRVISPLADGADRLVAQAGLSQGYTLHCPLPFARDRYMQDFDECSRQEFLKLLGQAERVLELDSAYHGQGHAANTDGYGAVARTLLAHSDLLIAIWDGTTRDAVTGRAKVEAHGTAYAVRTAADLGMPVVWIDAKAPHHAMLRYRDSLGVPQLYEMQEIPLPSSDQDVPPRRHQMIRLGEIVHQLLGPAEGGHVSQEGAGSHRSEEVDLSRQYFHEPHPENAPWHERLLGNLWKQFCGLLVRPEKQPALRPVSSEEGRDLSEDPRDLSRQHQLLHQIRETVRRHSEPADKLAGRYASLYRSSFLINYLLAPLAVTLALLTVIGDWFEHSKDVFAVGELCVLAVLGLNYWKATRGHWQQKLTDYRLLAEQLRHQEFLGPLGLVIQLRGPAPYQHEHPHSYWMTRHLRSIIREAGLPHADLNDEIYRQEVQRMLLKEWIEDQLSYHAENARRMETIETRLHTFVVSIFFIVVGACGAHLAEIFLEMGLNERWWPGLLLTLLTVTGPAWAGAAHALSQQAELKRLHRRSEAMAHTLKSLQQQLLEDRPMRVLRQIAEQAAAAMSDEAFDWRLQYRMPESVVA